MPTFEQFVKGEVPEQDNPFYHHRITGSRDWDLGGSRVKLWDGGPSWTGWKNQGQIELMVKAGWRLEIEIRHENDNYFETSGYAEARKDSRFKAYGTGTLGNDSVAQFVMYGGSALAVSSESLDLSDTYENDSLSGGLGNTSWLQMEETGTAAGGGFWGGVATHVYLTPSPQYFVGGQYMRDPDYPEDFPRSIKWADGDDNVFVKLISIERIPFEQSAQDYSSSVDSTGVTQDQLDDTDSQVAVFSEWTYDRIYENQEDPYGWFYDISVAFERFDQIYSVMVNGITASNPTWGIETPIEQNALDWAEALQEQFQDSGLPVAYQLEKADPEPVPPPIVPKLPTIPNPLAPKDNLLRNILIGGVVLLVAGIFIYNFAQAAGQGVAQKVVGGE